MNSSSYINRSRGRSGTATRFRSGSAARLLAELRKEWRGTLLILAQPAEELGKGARMMIQDGLFEKVPEPDYAIALHVDAGLPAGRIGLVSGWAAANVDSVELASGCAAS